MTQVKRMSLDIRPATEDDLDVIRRIAYETWPHTFKAILSTAQIDYMLAWLYAIPRMRAQVASGEHVFHLAFVDDVPVGFVAHQLDHPSKGVAKIHKLYILPSMQRHGVGRALIDTVRRIAQLANQQTLVLNVNKHNDAVRFYEANGFHRAGEEVIDIGEGYVMDDVIMQREIR